MANVTGSQVVAKAKTYKGKYRKQGNKFEKHFAGKYGISKAGKMPNNMGYCTLYCGYVLDMLGAFDLIPHKSLKKWWHTQKLLAWYKKNKPSWVVTDPSKAKVGALAFKKVGSTKNKSTGHTSIFEKWDGKYVHTVDGNVNGGVITRKKTRDWYVAFVNLPYAETKTSNKTTTSSSKEITSTRLSTGTTYILLEDMNLRTGASSNANKVKAANMTEYAKKHLTSDGLLAKGTRISFTKVYKDGKGAEWVKLSSGYMCAIGSTGKYFIAKASEVKEETSTPTASSGSLQYATFPMKILRFSAIWNTSTPHKKCSGGSPKDYPTDLVSADTGRDWFYAPCDIVCLKVYGKASHGLWFRSKEKVQMPVGVGYLYFMAEHESVSGFKVGKTYKKGTKLFTEGRAGNATGNHIHLSCGWSPTLKSLGSGWKRNSRGAWVLYIPGVKNIKIFDAFYLDKSFTTSVRDKRHTFKEVPKVVCNFKVVTQGSNLNVRDKDNKVIGTIANGTQVHVIESGDTKSKIDYPVNGYVASKYLKKI